MSYSVPNQFSTQSGNVPASQLDANFSAAIAASNNAFLVGTFGSIPAPDGIGNGRYYFATDTQTLYRDNGAAWVQVSPSVTALQTTGDVKLSFKTVADPGWVLMNDTTIGDAASGATGRANADTSALFQLIWNNVANIWAAVSGGRGANAVADFNAHKTIALPKALGRVFAGYGSGTTNASGVDADVDVAGDTLAVPANNNTWNTGMPVVFTLTSGTITGLTTGFTYYIIRNNSTTVQLASSLVNAQNGTQINITAKSSPVWNISYLFTTRALGEQAGEDAHAQSSTELVPHTHVINTDDGSGGGGTRIRMETSANSLTFPTNSSGASNAMNIMQGTLFLNVMIKL